MDEYSRGLSTKEVAKLLNIGLASAQRFMREYGTLKINRFVISQSKFRLLQMNGEIAAWISAYEKSCAWQRKQFAQKGQKDGQL